MNIAICDDDIETVRKIKDDIIRISGEMKVNMDITSFFSGKKLLDVMEKENNIFDILLLDIDMPDISGLEVAKVLREKNVNIIIIFISSYENYVFDSIEYTPFRYIRKFRVKEELPLALRAAQVLIEKKDKYIVIKSDNVQHRITHTEICYFEIVKRKSYIHLADSRILCTWKTIKDFYIELDDNDFVKIHSGCAVNMKYIKEYSNYDITLDNGEKLMASRSGIKNLKDRLAQYWSEA